jgi:hypothetical protein
MARGRRRLSTGSRLADSHSADDWRSARTVAHLHGSHTDAISSSDDNFHYGYSHLLGNPHTH